MLQRERMLDPSHTQARLVPAEDTAEIERRKAKFQEKKARRLARKAAEASQIN